MYANDPFNACGVDALDLDGSVEIAVQAHFTPDIDDLAYLIVDEPVDVMLEQVDHKIYHGY